MTEDQIIAQCAERFKQSAASHAQWKTEQEAFDKWLWGNGSQWSEAEISAMPANVQS